MTIYRLRPVESSSEPGFTGKDSIGRAHRHRCAPLVTALAVTALLLCGARAVAHPCLEEGNTPIFSQTQAQNAPPGTLVSTLAGDVFENAGDNPRFYELVGFSPTEYINENDSQIAGGRVFVRVKTAAELSALASPPASPFTVNADVWMTNDMGCKTRTTTLAYTTSYARTDPDTGGLTTRDEVRVGAPVGTRVSIAPYGVFYYADNPRSAGTNPRFTDVTFSTSLDYYDEAAISESDGRLYVQAKTEEDLDALDAPPPGTFEITATVTMTNDEGHTATGGTVTFRTGYNPPR